MKTLAEETKVILVEPLGGLNVGSVARLCENFGIRELRLVAPRCDLSKEEAIRMAVKGKTLLKEAKQFPSLLDAISDCDHIIATCGRIDHGDIPLFSAKEALKTSLETFSSSTIALVFGREDRGLTNQELLLAQKVIKINTNSSYQSLNLSHAVAIVLHELTSLSTDSYPTTQDKALALPLEINNFLSDSESLFIQIGFLYKHTANSRMAKIRGLLQRAKVTQEELNLIRGVLRQMRWAIKNRNY